MAPVAGRFFALEDAEIDTAVVADTGGTTYDVSLVRRGVIPRTDETWIGEPYFGHMTGFPSVDVKSVGAGGGSIAWVDDGGLLHVGPRSAGADPGPACYGRGNAEPTVTDASLVLGHLDGDAFLGGAMRLNPALSVQAITDHVAAPLGLSVDEAADAVLGLATEHMVQAISEITINQGIDPAEAVLIGGGGAAGLNSVAIARRLGFRQLIFPHVGATLSAAGALLSEITRDFSATLPTSSTDFDFEAVGKTLQRLRADARRFTRGVATSVVGTKLESYANVRYPGQIWQLDVPFAGAAIEHRQDVDELVRAFHGLHEEIFAIAQPESPVEILGWRVRAACRQPEVSLVVGGAPSASQADRSRSAFFRALGRTDVPIADASSLGATPRRGPLIVESPFTTVIVDPGAAITRTAAGSLLVSLDAREH